MTFSYLSDILFNQKRYFNRLRQFPLPWAFALGIYLASLAAASIFYSLKPAGFPEGSFSADIESHTFFFWLVISAAGCLLTLVTGLGIWFVLRYVATSTATISQVLIVIFSSHLYYLLLFTVLGLASLWQQAALYKTAEIIFSFAGLFFTIKGIRSLARVTVLKVFLAIFVSSVVVTACILGLCLTGLMPVSIFKAVLLI